MAEWVKGTGGVVGGPVGAAASVVVDVSAEAAWRVVTDVRNHVRWIPMTRIDATASLAVGDRFSAVSGPGALRGWPGLVDRMVVERADPPSTDAGTPGVAVYRKLGPVLLGHASVRVEPRGPASCRLVWVEAVHLRGLPARLTTPVLGVPARWMLQHALRGIRRELA